MMGMCIYTECTCTIWNNLSEDNQSAWNSNFNSAECATTN